MSPLNMTAQAASSIRPCMCSSFSSISNHSQASETYALMRNALLAGRPCPCASACRKMALSRPVCVDGGTTSETRSLRCVYGLLDVEATGFLEKAASCTWLSVSQTARKPLKILFARTILPVAMQTSSRFSCSTVDEAGYTVCCDKPDVRSLSASGNGTAS